MNMAGDVSLASGDSYWGNNLTAAVLNGTIPQWRLDDMVTRIMSAYYQVGRDRTSIPTNFYSWSSETYGNLYGMAGEGFQQINWHVDVQADHAKLIREIGSASTVLLKNVNKALPLNKPKSIAVIGEDAHDNPEGPNACFDRACNVGTLAMGWGSGTANFPYLIAPNTALTAQAAADGTTYANISDNYNFAAVTEAITATDAVIVFANANSGERYLAVDDNFGDRNNLTLWGNGDALIEHVASLHPNTIVVLHTVGAVIVEKFKNHPNITALLWAGLPGQESGNAITDILYGKCNPSAKSVFTWAKKREDYGVDVIYNPTTPTTEAPQIDFQEGVFVDYRHFDKNSIEPSYEFGFGLSYTTFSYSNLLIKKEDVGPYLATTGMTEAAPTFGTINYNASYTFPAGFHRVPGYIYTYLDAPVPTGGDDSEWPQGSREGTPQPKLPAGGAPGGNAQLFDTVYTVTATVTNTGDVKGTEIPQLVRLPSLRDPYRLLPPFIFSVMLPVHTLAVHLPRWTLRPSCGAEGVRRAESGRGREPDVQGGDHEAGYLELGPGEPELGREPVPEEGVCGVQLEESAARGGFDVDSNEKPISLEQTGFGF